MLITHDNKLQITKELAKSPYLAKLENYSDQQLFEKMALFGLAIDSTNLARLLPKFESVEFLLNYLFVEHNLDASSASDWIYLCLTELWKRMQPDRLVIEHVYELIGDGLEHERALFEAPLAAECYQKAWLAIKGIMERMGMSSFAEFDIMFDDSHYDFLEIFVSHASILWDAGQEHPRYYGQCITFCTELLAALPEDDNEYSDAIDGLRSYMAMSYASSGEREKAIELLQQWLAADPTWGWGWIELSEKYGDPPVKDLAQAEQILQEALLVPDLRDRIDVMDRCCEILSQRGQTIASKRMAKQMEPLGKSTRQKVVDFIKNPANVVSIEQLSKLQYSFAPHKKKIGRNGPCPCKSNKKYKKCCGRTFWR